MVPRDRLSTTFTFLMVSVCALLACAPITARAQCEYEIIFLDDGPNCFGNPAPTSAWAINETGIAVGEFSCLGNDVACWWTTDTGAGPFTFALPPGVLYSEALDVNDSGQAVIHANTAIAEISGVVDGSQYTPLEIPLGGDFIWPKSISNAGHVVGYWGNGATGVPVGNGAFVWYGDEVIDLSPLLGTYYSKAVDINERGDIAGSMGQSWTNAHGFLIRNGLVIDLGTHPVGQSMLPEALNNHGAVVGDWTIDPWPPPIVRHAFLWYRGRAIDLGTLPGTEWSAAMDVNNHFQIVGNSNEGAPSRGFLWMNGVMHDLNDLIDCGYLCSVAAAFGINDQGEIACDLTVAGHTRAAVMKPIRSAGDVTFDCRVDQRDLAQVLNAWGGLCDECAEDLSGDGQVDHADLMEVLDNWGSPLGGPT